MTFSQCFTFSYQGKVWRRSDSFLWTPKCIPVNIIAQDVVCDACGTSYALYTVTSVYSIQKSTTNIQNRLPKTRKQVIQTASRWQKIQKLKLWETELISKKVWRKRKEKMFKIRDWSLLHVEQYKNCCWRTNFFRKCSYSDLPTFHWSMTTATDHDKYEPTEHHQQRN